MWVFFDEPRAPLKFTSLLACLSDLPLLSVLLFMKLLLMICLPSPCSNPGCLSFLSTGLFPRTFFQNLSSLVLDCLYLLDTNSLVRFQCNGGNEQQQQQQKAAAKQGKQTGSSCSSSVCHCPQIPISTAILSLGLSYCVSDISLCLLANQTQNSTKITDSIQK